MDWSDHALWWPQKNMWLTRTRSTLNQYGVQADALLYFTPMHKVLRIQLPDLRFLDMRVDLSVKCFAAVKGLCKELGIRHPEELSFCRPLGPEHLKKNCRIMGATSRQRGRDMYIPAVSPHRGGSHEREGRVPSSSAFHSSPVAPLDGKSTPGLYDERTSTPIGSPWSNGSASRQQQQSQQHSSIQRHQQSSPLIRNGTSPILAPLPATHQSPASTVNPAIDSNSFLFGRDPVSQVPNLSISPSAPTSDAKSLLLHPRSLAEKARLNSAWLDSSLSLYEQDVREFDLLLLRFKFFSFYDLNAKLDAVRINQIYEQARWSLLTEEVECTENEAMMFAGLQVQASLQSKNPDAGGLEESSSGGRNDDDIDAALNDLQAQLEGGSLGLNGSSSSASQHQSHHHTSSSTPSHHLSYVHQYSSPGDVIHVPELSDYLRFSKPRRFTLKTTKKLYFVFRETRLYAFKTREDRFGEPCFQISLRGCEITPDVNLSQLRYAIKLEVPLQDGMTEYNIRFNSEEQYAKWLAAFRLASKGKTMSDSAFESEVRQILDFLSIQHPAPVPRSLPPARTPLSVHSVDLNPEDYVPPRFLRKMKGRNQVVSRILESHANVRNLGLTEAKLQLIKAWQALPDYGVSLFVVHLAGSKKEVSRSSGIQRMRRGRRTHAHTQIAVWQSNLVVASRFLLHLLRSRG